MKFTYIGNDDQENKIELEDCYDYKKNVFLLKTIENADLDSKSAITVCLTKNLFMGLFTYRSNEIISIPTMHLSLELCQNTSLNNNSCAQEEDIFAAIKTRRFKSVSRKQHLILKILKLLGREYMSINLLKFMKI